MSQVRIELKRRMARSVDVVRAQALDMAHHIRKNVHKELKYTILNESSDGCRVRAETRLLGIKQVDELEIRGHSDGTVTQTYVGGANVGLQIQFRFEAAGDNATWVLATAVAPLRGWKRLAKPLLAVALRKLGEQALEEDRADLEEGNYQPTSRAA